MDATALRLRAKQIALNCVAVCPKASDIICDLREDCLSLAGRLQLEADAFRGKSRAYLVAGDLMALTDQLSDADQPGGAGTNDSALLAHALRP